jgi:hypothetical protein
MGKRVMNNLLKLEKRYQWPVLKEINGFGLDIYRDADPILLEKFIQSIKDEKQVKSHNEKGKIIYERIELFKSIFAFSKKDLERCKKISERFEKKLIKIKKKRLFKIGLGITTLSAAATGTYLLIKKSKDKERKNKEGKTKIIEDKIRIRK